MIHKIAPFTVNKKPNFFSTHSLTPPPFVLAIQHKKDIKDKKENRDERDSEYFCIFFQIDKKNYKNLLIYNKLNGKFVISHNDDKQHRYANLPVNIHPT